VLQPWSCGQGVATIAISCCLCHSLCPFLISLTVINAKMLPFQRFPTKLEYLLPPHAALAYVTCSLGFKIQTGNMYLGNSVVSRPNAWAMACCGIVCLLPCTAAAHGTTSRNQHTWSQCYTKLQQGLRFCHAEPLTQDWNPMRSAVASVKRWTMGLPRNMAKLASNRRK
jgi:hypothetical protein